MLENERDISSSSELVPFERIELKPYEGTDVRIIQSVGEVRDLAAFRDSFFGATSGGLIKLSPEGELLHHYSVLDGLPESDLTAVAVYQDRLFIGTRSKGLVVFDGEHFSSFRWNDRQAQTITSLAASGADLLIGTFAGGLIRYDDANFVEIKPAGQRLPRITRVVNDGSRLYVGTFDNGLWLYESSVWSHITSTDGLASNRVVGIAPYDERIYVATDLGLAAHDPSGTRTVTDVSMLSDIAVLNDHLMLSKDSGELLSFDKQLGTISDHGGLLDARLVSTGERTFEISDRGVAEIVNGHPKQFFNPEPNSLTNNFVSALAFDRDSRMWVGTFRNGIDVISNGTGKARHIETDAVREINFLEPDDAGMRAATTGGLLAIGDDLSIKQNLTKNDSLPSNSVTHFSGSVIATAKGLVFIDKGKPIILSTVQGLPSNSLYATLQVGRKLYAGTLGGLAEIDGHRVTRTFKDSNSGLTVNWVTSLCAANDRIFVGTYGGGIYELLPSGEIRSFQAEIGKFTVNMNSIYTDGERLYIGALDGMRVLDLRSQKWQTIRDVLPSENVMSITGDDRAVYFGTASGIERIEKRHFTENQK
jgi:ligand-binding sensor domain-containing protein